MSTTQVMQPTEVQVAPALVAAVEETTGPDPAAIGPAMGQAFGTLMAGLQKSGLAPAGPPRAVYTVATAEETRFLVAIPIATRPESAVQAPLTIRELDGGRFLRFEHIGPYEQLMAKYEEITSWLIDRGLMTSRTDWDRYMPMWEEYLNDPETTPPDQLLTYIYLPTG
jgi:effector-binding domain-containing protein